jgi:ATP-dependent DNA helicase DinG
MEDKKKKIYGPNGLLAEVFGSTYQERDQQILLSRLINRGIKHNINMVVEAPTGVGKSLGATIPLMHRLEQEDEHNRKYLIVTATKVLQDQYIRKELPMLRDKLGFNFTFAVMKGMQNYVCYLKADEEFSRKSMASKWLRQWLAKNPSGELDGLSAEDTLHASTLDITTDTDSCLRQKCPFYAKCTYYAARRVAWVSDVIVANYHVFLAHMELFTEYEKFMLLPRASNILFDEAHVIKDLARDFFEYGIAQQGIQRIIKYLNRSYPDNAVNLRSASDRFFAFLNNYLGSVSNRLIYLMKLKDFLNYSLPMRLALATSSMLVESDVSHMLTSLGNPDFKDQKGLLYAKRVNKQIKNVLDLLSKIEEILTNEPGGTKRTNLTTWVERTKDNISIRSKPIDVSNVFAATLPSLCNQASFMSATIHMKSFAAELGLNRMPNKFETKILTEVFDYGKNSAFYLPDVGDPNTPDYDKNVADLICRLVEMIGGGILALFTSYRALEITRDAIENMQVPGLKHPLLWQKSGESVNHLIKEFCKGDRVLLGSRGFFQGVDFAGDMLKVVIINQIPFKHHDDPVIQAMTFFKDPSWFQKEQIPHAAILFKQAVGRLIRRDTDTGVILCCDHRLTSKPYGSQILGGLPKQMPILDEWDEFIEKLEKFTGFKKE